MALGGLGPLDPNAVAATKLKSSGMSAQEVAFKRKAMELDLGKSALAAEVKNKATDQKNKEANLKAFPPIGDTVALPYTQAWRQRMVAEQNQLANDLALYKQGKGSDPNNPLSEAGMARAARNAQHKQYAANTNSWYKLTNDLIDDIRKNSGSYVDGALEEALAAQRDVSVAETGEYPDLSRRLFDLDKYLGTKLGAIKAGGGGKAVTLKDGSIKTTSSEYILENDVKAGIQEALTKPEAQAEALRRFEGLSKDDQDAVLEFAQNNNMPPEAAMLYNLLKPVYSYTKYKENLQRPAASGDDAKRQSAKELLETGFGIVGGAAQGKSISDAFPGAKVEDIKTFVDKYPKVLEMADKRFDLASNQEVLTNYNGLHYDTQVLGDGKKIPVKIRGIVRDSNSGDTRVIYSTDQKGTDVTMSPAIPKKEFYSKVIRPIAINNPEYDINILDKVAQDEYQLIDNSGGQIALPERGPSSRFDPPKAQRGRFDPK